MLNGTKKLKCSEINKEPRLHKRPMLVEMVINRDYIDCYITSISYGYTPMP